LEQDTDADALARPKTAPTKTDQLDPLPNQDLEPAVAQQTPEQSRTKKLVAKSIETKIAQQYQRKTVSKQSAEQEAQARLV
jgi:hypothetical protein